MDQATPVEEFRAIEVWDPDAEEYTTMGVTLERNHRSMMLNPHGVPTTGIPYTTSQEGRERIWRRFREATHDGPFSDALRAEICFTFEDCPHTVQTLVELESGWSVMLCERCGNTDARECRHGSSEWQLDGQLLICPNCGIDGT